MTKDSNNINLDENVNSSLPPSQFLLHPSNIINNACPFPTSWNITPDINHSFSLASNAIINPLQLRNVYISGLPAHYRPSDFRALCQRFGRVEASKLCVDGSTTPTKGYGFALFCTEDSAAACIQGLNNALLCGRRLQARYADHGATPCATDGPQNRRVAPRVLSSDEAGAVLLEGGDSITQGMDLNIKQLPPPPPPPPFPQGLTPGLPMSALGNVAMRIPNTPMMVAAAPGSLGQDVMPLSVAPLQPKPLYGVPMSMPYTFVSVLQGMPTPRYYLTS